MEKHKCKLCSRTFSNGRALGGHMKAHLATLPLPPPPPPYPSSSFSSSSSSSSSSDSEKQSIRETEHNNKTLIYALRENPKKTFKLSSESVTESMNIMMMTTTRQRSKRNRSYFITPNLSFVADPPEPVLSSVSDGSTEEHIALCLMMLSRDTWQQKKKQEHEEDDDEIKKVKKKKKNECEGCGKTFRSSRALGSHRSICCRGESGTGGGGERVFECPFCLKVFGSGQALGGHKRSHLMGISATNSTSIVSDSVMIMKDSNSNSRRRFIDLNLPAPVDEDGELSVVSDVSDA